MKANRTSAFDIWKNYQWVQSMILRINLKLFPNDDNYAHELTKEEHSEKTSQYFQKPNYDSADKLFASMIILISDY